MPSPEDVARDFSSWTDFFCFSIPILTQVPLYLAFFLRFASFELPYAGTRSPLSDDYSAATLLIRSSERSGPWASLPRSLIWATYSKLRKKLFKLASRARVSITQQEMHLATKQSGSHLLSQIVPRAACSRSKRGRRGVRKRLNRANRSTLEGLSTGCEVFARNRADVTSVEDMVEMMKVKYGLAKCIWVMVRGCPAWATSTFCASATPRRIVGSRKPPC